ncbi:MAG: pirin family protein [Pseudomonadota bacterium]|nr:pirin family protein [Pseudomonadota bacterium]
MSVTLRPANARGHANHGWLDSWHTFSFADYYDAEQMGFGPLRVINDDTVQPGGGFAPHGHRDMEIISYVVSGALQHRDSLGGGSVIRPGDVQAMSAGSGVRHSEFNPSATEAAHFLQIWIQPDAKGVAPRYDQRGFPEAERQGKLRLIASRDGRDQSLPIHQDASVFATTLDAGASLAHVLGEGRRAWVQMVTGAASLNGVELAAGDGAAIVDERELRLQSLAPQSQILLFDLP